VPVDFIAVAASTSLAAFGPFVAANHAPVRSPDILIGTPLDRERWKAWFDLPSFGFRPMRFRVSVVSGDHRLADAGSLNKILTSRPVPIQVGVLLH
jgi:hypothetical protein